MSKERLPLGDYPYSIKISRGELRLAVEHRAETGEPIQSWIRRLICESTRPSEGSAIQYGDRLISMDDKEKQLIEELANAEHAGWSRWMAYLFSKCFNNPDGSCTIPAELVAHWTKQLNTVYGDLSQQEKEADRAEVQEIIPIIRKYLNGS